MNIDDQFRQAMGEKADELAGRKPRFEELTTGTAHSATRARRHRIRTLSAVGGLAAAAALVAVVLLALPSNTQDATQVFTAEPDLLVPEDVGEGRGTPTAVATTGPVTASTSTAGQGDPLTDATIEPTPKPDAEPAAPTATPLPAPQVVDAPESSASAVPTPTAAVQPEVTPYPGRISIWYPGPNCGPHVAEPVLMPLSFDAEMLANATLEFQEYAAPSVDLEIASVDVAVANGIAQVDLYLATGQTRRFASLSSCETHTLFTSLELTLQGVARLGINEVRFGGDAAELFDDGPPPTPDPTSTPSPTPTSTAEAEDTPLVATFTHIVAATTAQIEFFDGPGGAPLLPSVQGVDLPGVNPNVYGKRLVMRVTTGQPGDAWIEVHVVGAPGNRAWIENLGLDWASSNYLVQMRLSTSTITVFNGQQLIATGPLQHAAPGVTPLGDALIEYVLDNGPRGTLIALGREAPAAPATGGVRMIALQESDGRFGQVDSFGGVNTTAEMVQLVASLPVGSRVHIAD